MRLLTLLLILIAAPLHAAGNQLKNHPSPYLAMHGEDPVHWQAWDAEAVLARAARENKLILISSGYFSCHWCHVMQRESYQDAVVAEALNASFIAVKLDRELHPALDAHLIDFVERTQGTAGWPLNVFLTPEGYPLVGLTYAPRDNFLDILSRLQALWQEEPQRAVSLAREAMAMIVSQRAQLAQTDGADRNLHQALLEDALSQADEMAGGFGDQSRFPMAPQLSALLGLLEQYAEPRLAAFLQLTLDQMAGEGLRDHLAGGFFRYTVDPGWQVPHYEKMLYTQALMARVYLQAARLFNRPDYRAVARDTLDFVLTHMAGREGAYIASLSAVDAQGEEGGPYLWSQDQLQAALSPELLSLARRHWRMSGTPATEGGYLPLRGEPVEALASSGDVLAVQQRLDQARAQLMAARAQRGLPRDDKQLAGWNGLLLLALAEAAVELDEPRYHQAAERLADFLQHRLWDGKRLARALDGDRVIGQAGAEDYAYVAAGLLAAGRNVVADALLEVAWQRFHAKEGWRRSAEGLLPGMAVDPALTDDVLPSPSSLLIRLGRKSNAPGLRQQADGALADSRGITGRSPLWFADHALLLGREKPVQRR